METSQYEQALVQKALREKKRRFDAETPDYHDWLVKASPKFNWDWPHLRYIQSKVDLITERKINRLMLFVPPRHGKSELITVRYPVYTLERAPEQRVILGAYNSTFAEKLSRKSRALAIARGKVALDPKRTAAEDWLTIEGGGMRAVGVGGGITGQGGDLIIIDDPVKNREEAESAIVQQSVWEWYCDDLYTRLEPNAAIILIMTRWHDDDLAGRILKSEDAENWTVIKLPATGEGDDPEDYPVKRELGQALCPERYDEKALADRARVLGASYYALYQQRPVPPSGELFKLDWFTKRERQFPVGKLTQMWDTALEEKETSDCSAMVEGLVCDGRLYVAARVNERLAFPALTQTMRSNYERAGAETSVCIEDRASGKPAAQELRKQGIPVVEIPVGSKDKVVRAQSITNTCESGLITLVDVPGNCNDELVYQLLRFPKMKLKDLVDAFVHLVRRLRPVHDSWDQDDFKQLAISGAADFEVEEMEVEELDPHDMTVTEFA